MKKIFYIVLAFVSFSFFPVVSYAAITTESITKSSAIVKISDVLPNKVVKMTLNSNSSFVDAKSPTANDQGVASAYFTGLKSNTKYDIKITTNSGAISTSSFTTIAGDFDVVLTASEITSTSVKLTAKGLPLNKSVKFVVDKGSSTTPDYPTTPKTITSNSSGIATANFTGLAPGGSYVGSVQNDVVTLGIVKFSVNGSEPKNRNPSVTIKLFSENIDSTTKKFAWVFNVTTTNIPNGTSAVVYLMKGSEIDREGTTKITINNNSGTYYTQSVLDPKTHYSIIIKLSDPTITTKFSSTTPAIGETRDVSKINPVTGDVDSTITTTTNDETEDITPQSGSSSTPPTVYKLLAPIGDFKEAPENVGDYLNKIFLIAIGLCGALAVLMLIIAGIQYMGEESIFGKVDAKGKITDALLGLGIALAAYALLNTIDPRILNGKASISAVTLEIDPETEAVPWTGTSMGDNTTLCPEGFTNVSTYGSPATINVCKSISSKLKKLIDKAKAENIILSGSGSRTKAQQQALRTQNGCTNTSLASSKCTPPTARPGHSMHESGKAIDFNCNGKTMTASGGTNSVCYKWLKTNASSVAGLKNLNGESWHWSTTGK